MSRKLIGMSVVVAVLVISGCRDRAAAPESVSQPPPAVAEAVKAASTTPSTAITAVDASRLATAAWSRNACSLDMVDNGPPDATLAKDSPHLFQGFMLDQNGAPAGNFSFVFKGKEMFGVPTSTGKNRPDVADYFKDPSLSSSGFEFSTTLSAIPDGDYEIVLLLNRGAESFFCETGKKIRVAGQP